ncbi:MAG: radical SAM protein [candidate division KSB1 bacterium]|nr:radical SAM protein [candidate division KSB1 bacterium]
MQPTFLISHLNSGGLITNYSCSSRCRHCLYRCSPEWPNDYIDELTCRQNLATAKELGCRSMHIGGGEPVLNRRKLLRVIELFQEEDVVLDYVETNSSWYKDHKSACDLLTDLHRRGLDTLLISISPFHNEFIPFDRVNGVIKACKTTGMRVFLWIDDFYEELNSRDGSRCYDLQNYDAQYLQKLPQRYWTSPGGRALNFLGEHLGRIPLARILRVHAGGCSELEMVDHFHLDLYGNYVPGLCSGLSIRRDDLGASLDPEVYPMVTLLRKHGIRTFLEMACKKYDFQPRESYANKCDLCFDIRRYFVIECGMRTFELQPVYHYVEASSDE